MFNNRPYPHYIKTPFWYGLYAGGIIFPFMLLLYYTGHHPFLIPAFFDYRIIPLSIMVFFSLKEARNYHHKEDFYFWKGMVGTFVLTLSFTILVSALLYVYMSMNAHFVHDYIQLSLKQLNAFSEQDIERIGRGTYEDSMKLVQQADAYFMIARFSVQSFIISLFIGIVVSTVLRRPTPSPQKP